MCPFTAQIKYLVQALPAFLPLPAAFPDGLGAAAATAAAAAAAAAAEAAAGGSSPPAGGAASAAPAAGVAARCRSRPLALFRRPLGLGIGS